MLKDAGGIPAYGNSTHDWDLTVPDHPNPEYRWSTESAGGGDGRGQRVRVSRSASNDSRSSPRGGQDLLGNAIRSVRAARHRPR